MKTFIKLNTNKRVLALYCVVFLSTSLLLIFPCGPIRARTLYTVEVLLILLKNFSRRSNAEVKNEWSFSCPPPYMHSWSGKERLYLLPLPLYRRYKCYGITTTIGQNIKNANHNPNVYLTIHKYDSGFSFI